MAKKLFQHGVIDQEELNTMLQCINASESYLKNHYAYNIKLHDEKAEHCAHFALSSATETAFQQVCPEQHIHNQCHHCNLVDELFVAFKNAIKMAASNNLMDDEDLDNFEYELTQNHKAIIEYKHHVIRAFNQNHHWEAEINKCHLM